MNSCLHCAHYIKGWPPRQLPEGWVGTTRPQWADGSCQRPDNGGDCNFTKDEGICLFFTRVVKGSEELGE